MRALLKYTYATLKRSPKTTTEPLFADSFVPAFSIVTIPPVRRKTLHFHEHFEFDEAVLCVYEVLIKRNLLLAGVVRGRAGAVASAPGPRSAARPYEAPPPPLRFSLGAIHQTATSEFM